MFINEVYSITQWARRIDHIILSFKSEHLKFVFQGRQIVSGQGCHSVSKNDLYRTTIRFLLACTYSHLWISTYLILVCLINCWIFLAAWFWRLWEYVRLCIYKFKFIKKFQAYILLYYHQKIRLNTLWND